MPYASLADLTDRYGAHLLVALTDRADPPAGAIDTAAVDRALADTDALIDAHLAARYALPIAAPVPPVLRDIALAVAIWKLHTFAPDPKIEADWRDALRLLRDVAEGRARIPVAGAEPAGPGGTGARATDRARPLTEQTLRGFV